MKKFLLVAVISVFALVLTACGGSGASSDKANGSGKAKDGGSLIIGVTGIQKLSIRTTLLTV